MIIEAMMRPARLDWMEVPVAETGQDFEAAYHWFSLGRERGERAACSQMGSIRLLGQVGASDWKEALALFHEGAEKGERTSMGWLAYLYTSKDWPAFDAEKGYFWSVVSRELELAKAEDYIAASEPSLVLEERERIRAEAFLSTLEKGK